MFSIGGKKNKIPHLNEKKEERKEKSHLRYIIIIINNKNKKLMIVHPAVVFFFVVNHYRQTHIRKLGFSFIIFLPFIQMIQTDKQTSNYSRWPLFAWLSVSMMLTEFNQTLPHIEINKQQHKGEGILIIILICHQ